MSSQCPVCLCHTSGASTGGTNRGWTASKTSAKPSSTPATNSDVIFAEKGNAVPCRQGMIPPRKCRDQQLLYGTSIPKPTETIEQSSKGPTKDHCGGDSSSAALEQKKILHWKQADETCGISGLGAQLLNLPFGR